MDNILMFYFYSAKSFFGWNLLLCFLLLCNLIFHFQITFLLIDWFNNNLLFQQKALFRDFQLFFCISLALLFFSFPEKDCMNNYIQNIQSLLHRQNILYPRFFLSWILFNFIFIFIFYHFSFLVIGYRNVLVCFSLHFRFISFFLKKQ